MALKWQTNLLSLNRKQGLDFFGFLLRSGGIKNCEIVVKAAFDGLTNNPNGELKKIEQHWYESLRMGTPDYSVYNSELYLAEVWMCWFMYPKKYLREIQKPSSLLPNGIYQNLLKVKNIVDLGNGLGITSAVLKMLFPEARVIGTNVEGSSQMHLASILAESYGFEMASDVAEIGESVDFVLASEYFEHFENPLEHLGKVIDDIAPQHWLIANTFGGDSIGHFDWYNVGNKMIHGSKMGRVWGSEMRENNYEKVKTGMWNNRPAYFVKKKDCELLVEQ